MKISTYFKLAWFFSNKFFSFFFINLMINFFITYTQCLLLFFFYCYILHVFIDYIRDFVIIYVLIFSNSSYCFGKLFRFEISFKNTDPPAFNGFAYKITYILIFKSENSRSSLHNPKHFHPGLVSVNDSLILILVFFCISIACLA